MVFFSSWLEISVSRQLCLPNYFNYLFIILFLLIFGIFILTIDLAKKKIFKIYLKFFHTDEWESWWWFFLKFDWHTILQVDRWVGILLSPSLVLWVFVFNIYCFFFFILFSHLKYLVSGQWGCDENNFNKSMDWRWWNLADNKHYIDEKKK